MYKPWENSSGCKDPTAYAATKTVSEEDQRFADMLKAVKTLIRLSGYEILNRVEFRDRRSGRIFK